MSPSYQVILTTGQRSELEALLRREKPRSRKFIHARALLLCDAGPSGPAWSVLDAAAVLGVTGKTVESVKECFVEEGLEAALGRRLGRKPSRTVRNDVDFKASIFALACSDVPEGHKRWTFQLLADKLVELKIAESASQRTVKRVLKNMNISLAPPAADHQAQGAR